MHLLTEDFAVTIIVMYFWYQMKTSKISKKGQIDMSVVHLR